MSKVAKTTRTTATAQSKEIVQTQQDEELQNIQTTYRLDGKNVSNDLNCLHHIKGKRKIRYLMGIGPKLGDPPFEAWDEEDSMIMAWLWNSMTLDIRHMYVLGYRQGYLGRTSTEIF